MTGSQQYTPSPRQTRHADPERLRKELLARLHAIEDERGWDVCAWGPLLAALADLAAADLPMARLAEGHLDARRILAEARVDPEAKALYGVWASRSHATGLRGVPPPEPNGEWTLEGTLRFASGAGVIDRALVPVWTDDSTAQLLDLEVGSWGYDADVWRTEAMADSRSYTITLTEHRQQAQEVGPPGFYLDRPGFFPGGVGVAACWAGGAYGILERLDAALPSARLTPAQTARRGRAVADVALCRYLLTHATEVLGRHHAPRRLSTEIRFLVAEAVRRILGEVTTIAGPALLAFDEPLTRAVDDLRLYVAQENADADASYLGEHGGHA